MSFKQSLMNCSFQVKKNIKGQDEEQILREIIKSIQVEKNNNFLTLRTITQISEKSLDLPKCEYIKLTSENRKQRREYRKQGNQKNYQQLVIKYNWQIEQILERNQVVICRALDISFEQFQESVMALRERGWFSQFSLIQASMRQKIKESIPSTRSINVDQLKQIVEYYQQVVGKKPRDLQDIINQLSTDQQIESLIPLAVNTVLADWVFEKFQIEEEDMIRMMQNPDADQQMQELMMQLGQAMFKLCPMAGM